MERVGQPSMDEGNRKTTRHDLVWVAARGLRHRAMCSYGWDGGRRFFLGAAKVDALLHAAGTGHEPAVPLVVRNSVN